MKTHAPTLYLLAALAAIALFPWAALAIEPTVIEPADPVTPHEIAVEQGVQYMDTGENEWKSETEISIGLNRHLKLGVSVPFVFEEEDNGELSDVGLFMEGVFNPDSESTMVGGELRLNFPTGEDSEGLGGEAQLRITQPLGTGEKHALHLNLTGFYDNVEEEDHHGCFSSHESTDKEFRFGAALGYSFNVTEATSLTTALSHEEDYEDSDDANLLELGLSHDFGPNFTAGLGVGTGLDDDSPDFQAKAVFQLRFKAGK
ncbi:MAG TPA: transporter [Candidatus Hydrogenedentes bacterium]|nr:transporter [Candidatus Hydrogenedentota bacterium]HQE82150.1 transporter [Candidatus Hydrogenedentota bacterium]HQH53656.1 transporter [Candidatus Hydrogenedentota bacterium]HQM51148.1 transporter [Candidatus Hydrogenedentota bacterium]